MTIIMSIRRCSKKVKTEGNLCHVAYLMDISSLITPGWLVAAYDIILPVN